MLNGQQAGAERSSAPASLSLRTPTYGDWLACGEIEKTVLVADPFADEGVDATMEFAVDPEAVVAWLRALTDAPADDLNAMSMSEGRRLYRELQLLLPPLETATVDSAAQVFDGAIVIALDKPLPGARGQIGEITLRRPRLGDWVTCGNPSVQRVAVEETRDAAKPRRLEQRVDRAAINRWVLALTGLPEAVLHLMTYADFRRVYAHLRPLLAERDEGN